MHRGHGEDSEGGSVASGEVDRHIEGVRPAGGSVDRHRNSLDGLQAHRAAHVTWPTRGLRKPSFQSESGPLFLSVDREPIPANPIAPAARPASTGEPGSGAWI